MLFEQYLESIGQRDLVRTFSPYTLHLERGDDPLIPSLEKQIRPATLQMGRLTKIEAKPEQSKHLETATARVCNLSVDWVQQRGQEVYTAGSRIPTVVSAGPPSPSILLLARVGADDVGSPDSFCSGTQAFGTPLEDAERRDLTINALFYNLRTRSIEDQTGKGLADLGFVPLKPKRIRTPLEPVKTFHDDPLRVVRAVRFAARFGREYELDTEMERAIERDEIKVGALSKLGSVRRPNAAREGLILQFADLTGSAAEPAKDQSGTRRHRAGQDAARYGRRGPLLSLGR